MALFFFFLGGGGGGVEVKEVNKLPTAFFK